MMVNDREYQEHKVFDELARYIEFYRQLAYSVFQFIPLGTRAIFNIDSYVFSSIQGTIASIRTILQQGRINDAYALLRKYFDSAIINIYTNLYLEDHFSITNFVIEQIDNWMQGKDQLPEYRRMSQYIRSSGKVTPITGIVYGDDRYKGIRDRCNDHTHYNFYRNILLNDSEIYVPRRGRELEQFSADVRDVLILHLAYLFFVNGHYMMSSDYIDCLECGIEPEPESQYWVAKFVQDIFDRPLAEERPDLAATIREHTSMKLA